jgi:hypothetical protein
MPRSAGLVLIGAFLVTRALGAWLALEPQHYSPDIAHELVIYQDKAVPILAEGGKPYGSVPLEYPPGALPLILAPEALPDPISYAAGFVSIQLLLDVLGFLGLWRLSGRWGSKTGLWLWVALVPALGPLVYLRLDMLPAVATIWTLERAAAGRWFTSGASLSAGILTKIYPIFFIPVMLWAASRRSRVLFCLGALWLVVPLIGFGDSLDDVARSVLGYHAHRSVQIESSWATPLLIAMRNGYESTITLSFGAFHIVDGITPTLKTAANIVSALVALGTTILAIRRVRTGQIQQAAAGMFMILVATMAVGLVFSPQFIIWLFALGAAVLCARDTGLRAPILALVPIALLTQLVYPFLYDRLLQLDPVAIFTLATRNILVIAVAVVVTWRLASRHASVEAGGTR